LSRGDLQCSWFPVDGHHLRARADVDANLAAALDEPRDEVFVEVLQRPDAPVHDCDGGPGPCRYMAELEGYVAAASEHDALRQCRQVEELIASGEVALAGDAQRERLATVPRR
jgi:hypothetical protein